MMGERYGLSDLRLFVAGRTHFSAVNNVEDHFTDHRNLTTGPNPHYGSLVVGGDVGEVLLPVAGETVVELKSDSCAFEEGCCVNGRWPRQETLTLLEIRSHLDSKFKEANQKGPLWDEVSRIMAEEHGFQRSGKKCREKFENLYKYYKKTREGKAGRQDGKHYRFFRQLEALYGENTRQVSQTKVLECNPYSRITNSVTEPPSQEHLQAAKLCDSISFSNSSEFNTSSSSADGDLSVDNNTMRKNESRCLKRGRKSWKSKLQELADLQMKKFMQIQEAWLEKLLTTLERKEQERISREEEWRKKESERFDREHKLWANDHAWIEARDIAIMEALSKITGGELKAMSPEQPTSTDLHDNHTENESKPFNSTINKRWPESEISSLIRLRSGMELQFGDGGYSKVGLWEEISAKMGQLGYERSARRCKEKWENINKYFRKTRECNKKRKENSRTCPYFQHLDSLYNGQDIHGHQNDDQVPEAMGIRSDDGPYPPHSNARAVATPDSCLHFLTGGGRLWDSSALKIDKERNG